MSDPTPRSSDDVVPDDARDDGLRTDGESHTDEPPRDERIADDEAIPDGSYTEESSPRYEETEDATRIEPGDDARDHPTTHPTTAPLATREDDRRAAETFGQPTSEQPMSGQPTYEQPTSGQPMSDQPGSDQPTSDQPTYEQPAAPAPAYEQPPTQARPVPPMFITPPQPPKKRHNRLFGIGVAALATIVFAMLWAALDIVFIFSRAGFTALDEAPRVLASSAYWIPVIVFFVAFALLVVIVNRARWAAYVFGGFAVGIAVYLGFVIGGLLTSNLDGASQQQITEAARQIALNPYAFGAGILGREVPVWFGAWISAHGRKLSARNAQARETYERELAEGPSAYAAESRPAY